MGRPPGPQLKLCKPRKSLFNTDLSAEEIAAQDWHDTAGHSLQDRNCWCCCTLCRVTNPHEQPARQAALADIEYRIRESAKHNRPADKKKKREHSR